MEIENDQIQVQKVFNKSAATAPTAVLKVRNPPAKIERTA